MGIVVVGLFVSDDLCFVYPLLVGVFVVVSGGMGLAQEKASSDDEPRHVLQVWKESRQHVQQHTETVNIHCGFIHFTNTVHSCMKYQIKLLLKLDIFKEENYMCALQHNKAD